MATGSNFIIKCKTENGSCIVRNFTEESTVIELKTHLSKEFDMPLECIKILCGYPPKALSEGTDDMKLKDVNISTGDTIIIEKEIKELNLGDGPNIGDSISENTVAREQNAETSSRPASGFNDMIGGIMMRHVVPSNNSCLFASIYFVLTHGELDAEQCAEMRRVIAHTISSNPSKYNQGYLGMQNHEYCAWIQNTDHWGGAIELAVLSEHFGVEIVTVDTINLKLLRFGENSNYLNRIFLIYDGIHYDALVLELDNSSMQTIFPVADERPLEMAMEIAREAKSSRQFTDVSNFTLRCMVCDLRLCGEKEARDHAMQSGHTNFGEINK